MGPGSMALKFRANHLEQLGLGSMALKFRANHLEQMGPGSMALKFRANLLEQMGLSSTALKFRTSLSLRLYTHQTPTSNSNLFHHHRRPFSKISFTISALRVFQPSRRSEIRTSHAVFPSASRALMSAPSSKQSFKV